MIRSFRGDQDRAWVERLGHRLSEEDLERALFGERSMVTMRRYDARKELVIVAWLWDGTDTYDLVRTLRDGLLAQGAPPEYRVWGQFATPAPTPEDMRRQSFEAAERALGFWLSEYRLFPSPWSNYIIAESNVGAILRDAAAFLARGSAL